MGRVSGQLILRAASTSSSVIGSRYCDSGLCWEWSWFFAATAALVTIGVASACFAAMQSTLSYLGAPPEYRSRVLGVLTLCIGTGPIGFLNVGWMAESFGAPTALVISAAEGLFVMLVLWVYAPAPRASSQPASAA